MKNRQDAIRVLWTGGYDSTFRMVQLSRYEVKIQPYYLCDIRISEERELAAISEITRDIRQHPGTKCTILPLARVRVEDVEPDQGITEAYLRLREKTSIGSQYDWLARFAKSIHGLELGLEKAETSKARSCILRFGNVKKMSEGHLAYCIIDREKSSDDLIKVFGGFPMWVL